MSPREKVARLRFVVENLSRAVEHAEGLTRSPNTWGRAYESTMSVVAALRDVRSAVRSRWTRERREACAHPAREWRHWDHEKDGWVYAVRRTKTDGRCLTCRKKLAPYEDLPCCGEYGTGSGVHSDDCGRVRHDAKGG